VLPLGIGGVGIIPLGVRIGRPTAAQQVPVGPSVLGTHQDIDQRVDAGGQIDEQVAGDIEPVHLGGALPYFGHRDGQIADDEPHEDHQYHFEQPPVFGTHPARVNGGGIRGVGHGGIV